MHELVQRLYPATLALLLAACGESAGPAPKNLVPLAERSPADPVIAEIYQRSCKSCHAVVGSQAPLTGDARDRLLRLLMTVPHGVLGMSPAIPGLVETSNNLAMVEQKNGRVNIVTSSRSSVMSTMAGVLATIRAAGEAVGAEVETHGGYPGWQPNLDSPVLGVVRDVYRGLKGLSRDGTGNENTPQVLRTAYNV